MTNQVKKELLSRCHHLKPIIWIGQKGLSESVMAEIELALDHHELIKINIAGADKETRKQISDNICTSTSAEIIQSIGNKLSIYRKKPEKPTA